MDKKFRLQTKSCCVNLPLRHLHSSPIYLTVERTDIGWQCEAKERFLFQNEASRNTYTTALPQEMAWLSELLVLPNPENHFGGGGRPQPAEWVTHAFAFVFSSFAQEVFLILDHQHLYIFTIQHVGYCLQQFDDGVMMKTRMKMMMISNNNDEDNGDWLGQYDMRRGLVDP